MKLRGIDHQLSWNCPSLISYRLVISPGRAFVNLLNDELTHRTSSFFWKWCILVTVTAGKNSQFIYITQAEHYCKMSFTEGQHYQLIMKIYEHCRKMMLIGGYDINS
jgi:hypothetical protein